MPEEKMVHLIVTEQQRDNFYAMNEFWEWIKGSGKVLQWLALIGLPLAAAIWALKNWFKKL